ncbi:MAG: methionyl-tRNA formyltransferase [Chloroflexi bacterium]|nr:methionyl-tRNA formyltransferase [Chloroflexota bacterium]
MKNTKVVFMGTPLFSVSIIEALIEISTVVAVVTQPDKPVGRGKKMEASPVKEKALQDDIPVLEPKRLRKDADILETLRNYCADLFVVAAYGQILPPNVLEMPKYGCINVHASLLPRWRGASPIQGAILAGDEKTGVTIMQMDEGMDTGAILIQRDLPVLREDTGETLSNRLSELGRDLLIEVLPAYLRGDLKPIPQDNTQATYTSLIKKEDGFLDLNLNAVVLERKVRAFNPWPGTYIPWKDSQLKIWKVEILKDVYLAPGDRGIHARYPIIGTKTDALCLTQVQVPGKKVVSGKDFLNGVKDW